MPKDLVIIYTDGACSPNPGTGGWGAVLISNQHNLRTEISGSEVDSTNNRMEMTAAIKALEALKKHCKVEKLTQNITPCAVWTFFFNVSENPKMMAKSGKKTCIKR